MIQYRRPSTQLNKEDLRFVLLSQYFFSLNAVEISVEPAECGGASGEIDMGNVKFSIHGDTLQMEAPDLEFCPEDPLIHTFTGTIDSHQNFVISLVCPASEDSEGCLMTMEYRLGGVFDDSGMSGVYHFITDEVNEDPDCADNFINYPDICTGSGTFSAVRVES